MEKVERAGRNRPEATPNKRDKEIPPFWANNGIDRHSMVLDSVNFYLKSNTSLIVDREMEYDLKSIGSRKSKLSGKPDAKKTLQWVFRVFRSARHKLYALVIAQFRVQYDQYFSSFSYFADLFTELFTEITVKYEKRGEYWPYCAR